MVLLSGRGHVELKAFHTLQRVNVSCSNDSLAHKAEQRSPPEGIKPQLVVLPGIVLEKWAYA